MSKNLSEYFIQKSKSTFEGYLAKLILFIKENGQFPIYSQNAKLTGWVDLQKRKFHLGILNQESINHLTLLGLDWENTDKIWLAKSSELMSFLTIREKLPSRNNPSKLLSWLTIQRINLNKGKLSDSQKVIIEKIELIIKEIPLTKKINSKFEASETDIDFQDKLASLIAFRVEHTNTWPEHKQVAVEEIKLSQWCRLQQRKFRKNKLSTEKVEQLKAIGFHFETNTEYWMLCYNDLITHFEKEYSIPPKSNYLHKWCKSQYKLFDHLSVDKQELLHKLRFKELF